ncbi:MAG: chemotaxis protein CheB, partial [Gammaproteobacteria bacterium]
MSVPLVGIGASAGGLEALIELLSNLSGDSGLAYLIVQHLDAEHTSILADILSKKTALPVTEATQNVLIEANHVYVIPPNTTMTVGNDHVVLKPRQKLGPPMPVDDLLESLAANGADAIGVILSGSGSDGALGMQAIKENGGITFAQDADSARFNGMPQAAISLGCVDFVLPPKKIAQHIKRIVRHPYLNISRATANAEPMAVDEESLKTIFRHLRNTCDIDFTHYKRGTITRRLARRLALHELESVAEYVALLDRDPAEAQAFCQDLLIRVTSFFRDAETFEALAETVFPHLLAGRSPQTPLRIWVPGCATGEEVYSIAICLVEYLGELFPQTPIQIFGTDVSHTAIEIARAGVYIENIARHVSEDRLRRFFVKVDSHYHIAKSIRDLCIFSRQDVTRDPPFSRIDLVSCRNLLIYLNPELQKRVMPVFHYALSPNGLLMLGVSEAIGAFSELFRPLNDKKIKIYLKKNVPSRTFLESRAASLPRAPSGDPKVAKEPVVTEGGSLQDEADRVTLSRYAPASVLCDDDLSVLRFRGDTSAFLVHASGPSSLNLQKLAHPDLLVQLGIAIQQARKTGKPIRTPSVRIESRVGLRTVSLEVIPLQPSANAGRSFLIFFEELPRAGAGVRPRLGAALWRRLRIAFGPGIGAAQPRDQDNERGRLARELEASRDYVRTLIEEHESAIEELKLAEEELLSSNEEFQSTNEELETAKEELQSTNEELSTTNDELRHRNRDFSRINEDLLQARDYADAIVETIHGPLLVLDENLRVIRANRAFYTTFKTTQKLTEQGLIYELGSRQWDDPALRHLFEETLPKNRSFDKYEVSRIFPAIGKRTMRLNGRALSWEGHSLILLAIEDVTDYQAALNALKSNEQRTNEFLAMLAHELRNPLAAIRNAWEIWRRGDAGPEIEKQAQAMLDRQLLKEVRLVDDLLDISRITRGVIVLNKQPVDLVQVVNHAIEETRFLFDAHHHELVVELPNAAVWVDGDATRLEQVMTNLLGNSIKFTAPGGRISIALERVEEDAILKVTDTGIGIAPELLPAIFDLFVQAERSVDRS